MPRFLWTQLANFGPSPRSGSAISYDSTRNRIVLFGGRSAASDYYGDTWEWDGTLWTQIEDIGPTPRFLCTMTYDAANKVSILFGGRDSNQKFLGDTWQWDGSRWTQLSDTGPASRSSHAMCFDTNRGRTVIFGGQPDIATTLGDTWEFDGTNWTRQQDVGPQPRAGHVLAFDPPNNRSILFGGLLPDGTSIGDTWSWDGTEWTKLTEFGPSPRLESALASTQDRSLVLYGGVNTVVAGPGRQIFADSWQFDGKHWTQRQDIGPGPLHEASIAFDDLRNQIILFGGITVAADGTNPVTANTWQLPTDPLQVASLDIASSVVGETPTSLTITLNRQAPPSGVVVSFFGPIFSTVGAELGPVTLPAGTRSVTISVAFAPVAAPTPVTFSAIVGTLSRSATITVTP